MKRKMFARDWMRKFSLQKRGAKEQSMWPGMTFYSPKKPDSTLCQIRSD